MTDITIRAFAKFRELFGAETSLSVQSEATVFDALTLFAEKVPAAKDELFELNGSQLVLKGHVVLMYNRERIDSDDAIDIHLEDGDEVVIYPPVSGG